MSLTFQPCLPPQTQLPLELPQGLLRDKTGLRQKANLYVITAQLGVSQGLRQRASTSPFVAPQTPCAQDRADEAPLLCAASGPVTVHISVLVCSVRIRDGRVRRSIND